MSNGDKSYQHMVVREADDGLPSWIVCFDGTQPAIYVDSCRAELMCAKLRSLCSDCRYRVVSFQVL